jgi:xanthine/uracil permease
MMSIEVTMVMIFSLGLSFLGTKEQLAFAVCSCALAFFGSPLLPGNIAWNDKYMTVTATAFFLVPLGANLGGMAVNPIYGGFFDNDKLNAVQYLSSVLGLLIFVLFIVQQIVGICQGTRFQEKPDQGEKFECVEVIKYDKQDNTTNYGVENGGFVNAKGTTGV